MATDDEDTGKNTKRCPKCETVKHHSEFTSQGYCRPCSRAYSRERDAKRRGAPTMRPRVASIKEVVANVQSRTAPPKEQAPRETPPALAPEVHSHDPDRRRVLLRSLGEALVNVLEDGEELAITALRVGSCVVIDGLDVSGRAS